MSKPNPKIAELESQLEEARGLAASRYLEAVDARNELAARTNTCECWKRDCDEWQRRYKTLMRVASIRLAHFEHLSIAAARRLEVLDPIVDFERKGLERLVEESLEGQPDDQPT